MSEQVDRESTGIGPLVRPTRSQAEVDLLPPFGKPEVSLKGELAVYAVAVAALGGACYLAWRRGVDA